MNPTRSEHFRSTRSKRTPKVGSAKVARERLLHITRQDRLTPEQRATMAAIQRRYAELARGAPPLTAGGLALQMANCMPNYGLGR